MRYNLAPLADAKGARFTFVWKIILYNCEAL